MKRGELYRVRSPSGDPKRSRVFVIVSRDSLLRTGFPTVVCAPVFSERHGLASEVAIGLEEGMKHDCAIECDALASLPRAALTDFVGSLGVHRLESLGRALRAATGAECSDDLPSEPLALEKSATPRRRPPTPRPPPGRPREKTRSPRKAGS